MSSIRGTARETPGDAPRIVRVAAGAIIVAIVAPGIVVLVGVVAARWQFPRLVPDAFTMRGLAYLAANRVRIASSLATSTLYALATVVGAFVVAVLPARVLARYEFRGRIALEALLLSPVLIPAITYGVGVHFAFIRLGLANTMAGVIVVLTASAYPYMLRALVAGFQQIHPDVDACAANLGAGLVTRLVCVHVPLLGPAIVAGGSIVFLVAFSDYFLVFLIGGGAVDSYTGFLFPFLTAGDRPIASALTALFVAVPVTLFAVVDLTVRRYYRRRGMVVGS